MFVLIYVSLPGGNVFLDDWLLWYELTPDMDHKLRGIPHVARILDPCIERPVVSPFNLPSFVDRLWASIAKLKM